MKSNQELGADPFEMWLRSELRRLRPAEGVSDAFRSRVDDVPESLGQQGWVRRLIEGSSGTLLFAGMAGVATLLLLALTLHGALLEPGAGGIAPDPTFDPAVEGPGLLHGVVPTLVIVPGIVAIATLAVGLRLVTRRRGIGGWPGALRLSGIVLLGVAAAGLALHPSFYWRDGSYGSAAGYIAPDDGPFGSDATPAFYAVVNPGDPLVMYVTITNPGPLPIRLEGLVADADSSPGLRARWTALTTATDPNTFPYTLDQLRTFEPVVVDPQGQLSLYLVAKAGACAYGPNFTVDAPNVGSYITRSRQIELAYSVFGLSSWAGFELPFLLVEPTRPGCA